MNKCWHHEAMIKWFCIWIKYRGKYEKYEKYDTVLIYFHLLLKWSYQETLVIEWRSDCWACSKGSIEFFRLDLYTKLHKETHLLCDKMILVAAIFSFDKQHKLIHPDRPSLLHKRCSLAICVMIREDWKCLVAQGKIM